MYDRSRKEKNDKYQPVKALAKFYQNLAHLFRNLQKNSVMKSLALPLLFVTTMVLLLVVVFSVMDFPYSWVFFATLFGQVLLVVTVYKILREAYHTDKTFEDFYEDYPIGRN